jgi:hypothetical protein
MLMLKRPLTDGSAGSGGHADRSLRAEEIRARRFACHFVNEMNHISQLIQSESYRWAGRFRWESTAIGSTRPGPVRTPVRGRTCACRISGTGARTSRDRWIGNIACRAGTSNYTELKRLSTGIK